MAAKPTRTMPPGVIGDEVKASSTEDSAARWKPSGMTTRKADASSSPEAKPVMSCMARSLSRPLTRRGDRPPASDRTSTTRMMSATVMALADSENESHSHRLSAMPGSLFVFRPVATERC